MNFCPELNFSFKILVIKYAQKYFRLKTVMVSLSAVLAYITNVSHEFRASHEIQKPTSSKKLA